MRIVTYCIHIITNWPLHDDHCAWLRRHDEEKTPTSRKTKQDRTTAAVYVQFTLFSLTASTSINRLNLPVTGSTTTGAQVRLLLKLPGVIVDPNASRLRHINFQLMRLFVFNWSSLLLRHRFSLYYFRLELCGCGLWTESPGYYSADALEVILTNREVQS